jgi:hypothetical protein
MDFLFVDESMNLGVIHKMRNALGENGMVSDLLRSLLKILGFVRFVSRKG